MFVTTKTGTLTSNAQIHVNNNTGNVNTNGTGSISLKSGNNLLINDTTDPEIVADLEVKGKGIIAATAQNAITLAPGEWAEVANAA